MDEMEENALNPDPNLLAPNDGVHREMKGLKDFLTPVGDLHGMPVYSNPVVPKGELWFLNTKGEIVGGMW